VTLRGEAAVYVEGPWSHRAVSANGTRLHVVESGDGPLVLLLHGFPEFWWTWREQLTTLSAAGYRAVALDLRGYGGSDKPPRGYDLVTAASDAAGLIRAGEATGSLSDTLARLIEMLTEQRELRMTILTAMAYPAVIILASFGVVMFFLFFLLPRLQTLLHSLGGKMPISTQILIALANFTLHYGIFVAIAAAIGLVSLWRWRATEAGREKSDAMLLRLPGIGPFIISQTVLQFSQTLGVLLQNGITSAEALRMTERQIVNRVHRKAFDGAIDRVLEGESLSAALGRTGCFPELVLDRLAVGENTGNVVPCLRDIASNYQKTISRQLNLFTKVLASAILAAVFVFVGFIAIAMIMAVLQVSSSFKVG